MKLKTRVICISCAGILAASVIVNIVICFYCYNELYDSAYGTATDSASEVFEKIISASEDYSAANGKNAENQDIYLDYCAKQMNDPYLACFFKGQEIYNRTVFTRDMLASWTYKESSGGKSDASGSHLQVGAGDVYDARVTWEGRNFLVFYKNTGTYALDMYYFVDITYVDRRMYRIVLTAAVLTAGSILAVGLCMYFLLKRSFAPLQELSEIAGEMADQQYSRRAPVRQMDEIGRLASNFNRMAEAVETHMQSLEASERKKTIFMGDLTHELKTPMTAISGYAQLLLTAKISEADKEEALYYIYSECHRLERLSKKMMRLLELDQAGTLALERQPVKTLFESAAQSCRMILKKKDITLEWTEHGESFLMDMDLMTDVMINLIDNAVKASPDGGKIELGCAADRIWVRDYGTGIPEEDQDKIMEPFYMVDKSRSRKSGGAGLGLALTAAIARLHHIEIHLESTPDEGTCFILQFVYNTMNT